MDRLKLVLLILLLTVCTLCSPAGTASPLPAHSYPTLIPSPLPSHKKPLPHLILAPEVPGVPEAPGLPIIDPIITDSASCTIPFTRIGNLILIQAKADTTTGFFVLDTGTPGLVLNITYFRRYTTTSQVESGGITGTAATAVQTTVDSLRLGPISYFHLNADLINLGHIENNKNVKIFGLLGMRLFEKFEMIIDYNNSVIILRMIGKKEPAAYRSPPLADTAAYTTVPITIDEGKIIVYIYLKGKRLRFIVDSGAETNVLDSRLPNHVFEQVEITRKVRLNGSGSSVVEALYGDIKGLKIGDRDIGSLPVLITNLQSMCDAYNNDCLDGMLGFDFLVLHKIGFNFVTRKMYIWK